jgi:acyl-CoA thioesterase-1
MLFSRKRFLLLLAALVLSTPAPLAAADTAAARKTILVLGDSLAAGYGVDPDQAWPALLQKKIDAAGLKIEVLNAGVSGDTTADGLQRLDWLLRRKADVLLLELGGNDGLRGLPVAATTTNLQAILDRVRQKYPAIKLVIAGMKMPPNMGPEYVDAFNKIYPELATKNHAALIPFLLEGVAGKPDLNLPDGIHPTPEGHRIVAQNVWAVLRRTLP